ncbi:uncharacterized protein LOC117958180 [Etheostoma cragini]|uniref:uncharacterized protein LOC117958180 n=1 Tax=Etheostoma cragini TaxID=417921 RepID=UPI00155E9DE6|nr:uncharacterized protein LOC117958180 [Etheostoma cragini]
MQCEWAEEDDLPYGAVPLVTDAPDDNKLYIMYHGTSSHNAQLILANGFKQSEEGMLGPGVYLSRDLRKASAYPKRHPISDKVVIKVMVNVGKVIAINHQGHAYQKTWHDYGYDTAWVPPWCRMVKTGLEEDCVWDPDRIKIINIIKPQRVQPYTCDACGCALLCIVILVMGLFQCICLIYLEKKLAGQKPNTTTVLTTPREPDINMPYEWAEDDFDLPDGVGRLGLTAPISGKKYVMYHGTTKRAAQLIRATGFTQSADGMLGRGVYLSRDLDKASRYPINHPESDRIVIKVLVNVGNVIVINYQGHRRQKTWHDSRYGEVYDTAWVPPNCGMVKSGLEEDCVWDPNRIKILKMIQPRPVPTFPLGLSAPDNNKCYVMYHGTTRHNAQLILANGFKQSEEGMLGPGVYLSRDLQKASAYPKHKPISEKVVIKVMVNVGRVIAIHYQGHPYQKTWHNYGYDTAWVPPKCGMVPSGLEEDCVWDPNRIKIINIINPRLVQ